MLLPVEIRFLVDVITLTPLRDGQTTGLALHDPFPPGIDHGFMFGHDHINIAQLVQPPLTESQEVLRSARTSLVSVRVFVRK